MSGRRVVVGVGAISAAVLLLSGCNGLRVASKTGNDEMTVTQPVKSVRLDTSSGDVHITVGQQAAVKRTVHYAADMPGPTSRVEGDTLVLEACPSDTCSIDYDVTLPTGASVLGETSSGDIDIAGMTEVRLKTSSGDKTVRDISGAVTLEGSSGKITLARVGGAATVKSTSGDVILSTVKGDVTVQNTSGHVSGSDLGGQATVSASSGDINLGLSATHSVKATATSGNVYVKVPKGTPYRVTAQTNSGSRDINVATDPAAGATMDLQSNSGDIAVNYT